MRPRVLIVACCVFALAAPGAALAQASKCRILKVVDWPVKFLRGHIVIDGGINGKKVGMILDTGATRSLILRSSAVRLELPREEAFGQRFYGVGGETKLEIATVDEFKLGEVSTKGMRLFVAGEGDFGEGSDMLLGEDFLQNFDVEFDLKNNAVRLFKPRDCDGVSLAYWTKEVPGEVEIDPIKPERAQITFRVQLNGKSIEAFLDSGAPTSSVSKQDAEAVGVTPETPGVVAGPASGGLGAKKVENWSGPFKSFAIGNESLEDIRIRFSDLFKDATYENTGSRVTKRAFQTQPMVIGADFLRSHRTLVSHSQQRLYFSYVGGPVFFAAPAPKPAAATDGATPEKKN